MSDFSLFSLFTAGLAVFATGANAYTKPTGDAPVGNPISQPGFMSIVPAGKPFTITWEPTTDGTVTLVLLKGPSENAVPQYAIVEKIPNDGSYDWSPKEDLEPTEAAEGYGIQLIDDKTGQYQYTTQFGISNPDYNANDSSSTESATASATGYSGHGGHGQHGGNGGWGHGGHNVHGGYTHSASGTATASGLTSSYTHKANGTVSSGSAHSTGHVIQNVTMIAPTGGYTSQAPVTSATVVDGSSASSSPTESTGPVQTDNAASGLVSSFGGLVLAAGVAVFAL